MDALVPAEIMALAPQLGGQDNVVPALSMGPFVATRQGLLILGDPTFEECYAYAQGLLVVHQAIVWYIGDLLNHTEGRYGETYAEITSLFPEYSLDYLRHIKMLCGKIPPPRRRMELSPSHHREVVSLPPEEQDRWLDRAVEEELPRDRLREAIRESRDPRRAFYDDLMRLRETASALAYRAPTEDDEEEMRLIVNLLDEMLTQERKRT